MNFLNLPFLSSTLVSKEKVGVVLQSVLFPAQQTDLYLCPFQLYHYHQLYFHTQQQVSHKQHLYHALEIRSKQWQVHSSHTNPCGKWQEYDHHF